MKRCFYPGSFDPPTLGHVDLIERAARLFDQVVVGVMINPDKKSMFTTQERVDMLAECTAHLDNVRVVHGKGTGALRKGIHDYLKKQKRVASFRLGEFGEGDAGVTIVKFKR